MIPFLGTPLDSATVGQILQTFAITDSLLSVAVQYTMGRAAMARWRRALWIAIGLMWASLVLPIFELLLSAQVTVTVFGVEIFNPLTKAAVIIWLLSVVRLLGIEYRIFTLDLIKFDKDGLGFEYASELWGVSGIDEILSRKDAKVVYPIVVVADESSRPWNILQRFVTFALAFEERAGVVYFTFTRPAGIIYKQLLDAQEKLVKDESRLGHSGGKPRFSASNLIIIDCYTELVKEATGTLDLGDCVIRAHPNNPHLVNQAYEKALRRLQSNECESVRVVYDALSDFLAFTDLELATQYLRHNMVWEEEKHVQSLYLLRADTLNDETAQYFQWFANGTLQLKRTEGSNPNEGYLAAEFRGPFKQPFSFNLTYEYDSKK